jgi:CheY-like chemotaxis protein
MDSSKKKLLLIDDNEIIRIMFSNIFWLHGLDDEYELISCDSIEKAMGFIENPATCPNIIFMGLVMPFEKNGKIETSAEAGFSLLRTIKGTSEYKKIRVVVFSSYDEEEYRDQALALGAEKYLKKGENMPQDLIEIIRSFDNASAS